MNKKWIILIIVVVVVLLLSIIVLLSKKRVVIEKNNIKHISFSYSTGNMIYSNVVYVIDLEEDGYYATIKPNGISDEAKKKVKVDQNTFEKLVNELIKYNVSSWDGFKKSDKNVLDGDGFSFSIRTKDDKRIEASGYMKWPKNYSEVKGVFNSMIGDLYKVKEYNAKDFESMNFSYSNGGSIANSQEIYDLNKKDGKYIASIKEKYKTSDEIIEVETDINFVYKVLDIINKYNVSSWDGFHENDSNVLDGESFYFSFQAGDNKISAGGYMSWPENYGKVKTELTEVFHSLYE